MRIDWAEHYRLDCNYMADRCKYYICANYPDMAALIAKECAHLARMAHL